VGLKDYCLNISEFEERSMICESGAESNGIYDRVEGEFLVVVKPILADVSEKIE
jgi:hypothetical protein